MTTTDTELREQVRQRYAAAAIAVSAGGASSDALAAEGCCGAPDVAGDAVSESGSCCGSGSVQV
ncbi:MAG: hypothetical protein ABJB98_10940, partial [Actinomycetota bacterium]